MQKLYKTLLVLWTITSCVELSCLRKSLYPDAYHGPFYVKLSLVRLYKDSVGGTLVKDKDSQSGDWGVMNPDKIECTCTAVCV